MGTTGDERVAIKEPIELQAQGFNNCRQDINALHRPVIDKAFSLTRKLYEQGHMVVSASAIDRKKPEGS